MIKPKLLLADDSVTIRKVVELTFADEGIDVTTTADSNTAMQRFVEIQPDIVLVDVGLDGINGYQICEMIKADDATKHIPVMLLVGSFEPFNQDEAARVGADSFLTKPFNSIRDLVGKVRTLLGRDLMDAAAGSPSESAPAEAAFFDPPGINQTAPPTPETADIESLYRNSFENTVKIENLETVDRLGDTGMDDEMIEASYRTPQPVEKFIDHFADDESIELTKEFDWSPESIVTKEMEGLEQRASEGFDGAETAAIGGNDVFDSAPNDSNIDPSTSPNACAEEVNEVDRVDSFVLDEKWPIATADFAPADQADEPGIHETIPNSVGKQTSIPRNAGASQTFSPEVIEKIANRVIEKLSDGVIREIAQIEVPRIAEKLIREALEQESKI